MALLFSQSSELLLKDPHSQADEEALGTSRTIREGNNRPTSFCRPPPRETPNTEEERKAQLLCLVMANQVLFPNPPTSRMGGRGAQAGNRCIKQSAGEDCFNSDSLYSPNS